MITNPHIVAYYNISFIVPGISYGRLQIPFACQYRERISGQRPKGMIGSVEQKFCPKGNGAKFSDF